MPGPSDLSRGNVQLNMLLSVTLSPASVANATSAEQTFTVHGLLVLTTALVDPFDHLVGVLLVDEHVPDGGEGVDLAREVDDPLLQLVQVKGGLGLDIF